MGRRDSASMRGCGGMSVCSDSEKAELRRLAAEENIEAEVINKRLTVNDNRSNLMIRY